MLGLKTAIATFLALTLVSGVGAALVAPFDAFWLGDSVRQASECGWGVGDDEQVGTARVSGFPPELTCTYVATSAREPMVVQDEDFWVFYLWAVPGAVFALTSMLLVGVALSSSMAQAERRRCRRLTSAECQSSFSNVSMKSWRSSCVPPMTMNW